MKKHKSVVAILLAVMMIFTFMPTMAFANVQPQGDRTASIGSWENDGSAVTVNSQKYAAKRYLDDDGQIVAKLDDSAYDSASLATIPYVADAYYYDLTGAQLKLADVYTQTSFEALFTNKVMSNPTMILKTPSYVEDYTNVAKTKEATLTGWTVTVDLPDSYVEDSEADQNVTLTAKIVSAGADGTKAHPNRIDNTTITKTVKVLGELPSIKSIKFYKDEVKDANVVATIASKDAEYVNNFAGFDYTGAAHKIVNSNVTGYTVSYSVLNPATGKYDAVAECPSVTNVGDTAKVKATVSWVETSSTGTSTTTTTRTKSVVFDLAVNAPAGDNAKLPAFGFDGEGNIPNDYADESFDIAKSYGYAVNAGDEYDPTEWIVATAASDATKVAVEANKADLKNFFKDFYTVTKTTRAAYPDYEFWAIKAKTADDIDAAEFKTLKTKYAALLKNFGKDSATSVADLGLTVSTGAGKAYVYLTVVTDDDYEVTFTKAITTKTFKGKKTTSKGKLKKNQAITFKAEAANGAVVKYKLVNVNTSKITINKTSGKVTIKKGLGKGTYKFKVKAYVPGVKDAYEVQNVTLKIKK